MGVFFRLLLRRRPSDTVTNGGSVPSNIDPDEPDWVDPSNSSSLLHPSHSASLTMLSGSLSSPSFSRHLCSSGGSSYSPVLGFNSAFRVDDARNPYRPEAMAFWSIPSRHSGYGWNLVPCFVIIPSTEFAHAARSRFWLSGYLPAERCIILDKFSSAVCCTVC